MMVRGAAPRGAVHAPHGFLLFQRPQELLSWGPLHAPTPPRDPHPRHSLSRARAGPHQHPRGSAPVSPRVTSSSLGHLALPGCCLCLGRPGSAAAARARGAGAARGRASGAGHTGRSCRCVQGLLSAHMAPRPRVPRARGCLGTARLLRGAGMGARGEVGRDPARSGRAGTGWRCWSPRQPRSWPGGKSPRCLSPVPK